MPFDTRRLQKGLDRRCLTHICGPLACALVSLTFPCAAPAEGEEPGKPTGWSTPTLPPAPLRPATDLWDTANATAVIYNDDVPESFELARFYAEKRGIPATQLIGISCSAAETVSREEYRTTVRDPILGALSERGFVRLASSANGTPVITSRTVSILAPVYGVPIRIERAKRADGKRPAAPAGKGDEASVDSELALLGVFDIKFEGPLKNPYFEQDVAFPKLGALPMFLVGRLDGPSPEVVKGMITDAIAAEESGLQGFAYFDLAKKGTGYEAGDQWVRGSEEILRSYGYPTIVESFPDRFPAYYPMRDAAFYFGWYTGHVDGPFVDPGFKFVRGAVACHLHSFSGQDLRQSTKHWTGPLLRRGAAASLGNVWEPYLALTVHFDILTDRLLKGYTFAEASAMATPALSWMNIAVGDPLYRPFKNRIVGPPVGEVPESESDFALFQRLTLRHSGENEADLKRALVDAAKARKSGFLLESAGLVSATGERYVEAVGLFEHALATYEPNSDRVRVQLHIAAMHRRSGDIAAAKAVLEGILKSSPEAPESRAATEILKRLEEAEK